MNNEYLEQSRNQMILDLRTKFLERKKPAYHQTFHGNIWIDETVFVTREEVMDYHQMFGGTLEECANELIYRFNSTHD